MEEKGHFVVFSLEELVLLRTRACIYSRVLMIYGYMNATEGQSSHTYPPSGHCK